MTSIRARVSGEADGPAVGSPALQEIIPAALIRRIGDLVQELVFDEGSTLMRQGEPGDDLFVVLQGRLAVLVEGDDGVARRVDEVHTHDVVGEMALLTRQPRTATVVATERTRVLRITREGFEQIAQSDPQAVHGFMRRVLRRLRRTQLAKVLTQLLDTIDDHVVREIEHKAHWLHVPSGTRLFSQHEPADSMFVVVNGRLRISQRSAGDADVVIEEAGHGRLIGDVAVLTGGLHTFSAEAIRDTHLLQIFAKDLHDLLHRHPAVMMSLARAAMRGLQGGDARQRAAMNHPSTYVLIAASHDVPLAEFAEAFTAAVRAFGTTARLSSESVDRALLNPGVAQAPDGTVASEALTAWLSNQEREHHALVLQGDPSWTPWTRRCALQGDRIVIVARASGSPVPDEAERELRKLELKGRVELVLLHAESTPRPTGTRAWLADREVAAHHHVRLRRASDVQRVARHLGGRATGLVLGGGGARGFAHIGVLQALQEAKIEIDMIGGTSIGALIGGCVAFDLSPEALRGLAQTFASPRKLLDRTLPIAALMAGAKVTALYQHIFGNTVIEDLWTPYFAVSSGLSSATAIVHRRGSLWRAVRASTALPAIFPPLLGEDDEVHVDGGVMNNMPLDVMRRFCQGGTVVGVNPMPVRDRVRSYHFGPSVSGWHALAGRLGLFRSTVRAPSILGSVMRATEINSAQKMRQPLFRDLADLLIEPDVGDFPILAFDRYAEIIDAGYRAAVQAIRTWHASDEVAMTRGDLAA